MYNIEDKAAAIKEVQRLLSLNETGFYDKNTEEAVKQKQEIAGLEATGTVDFATFEIIVSDYRYKKISNRVYKETPLEGNFPFNIGDYGYDIAVLNAMLAAVIEKHSLPLWRPKGNYYSKTTASAVEHLRSVFILDNGTHIDEIFYDRLKRW